MKLVPVILAGGSGDRLWPMSRKLYPKQFLPLISENTMFQETCSRLLGLADIEVVDPIIVCNSEHRFLVAEQLRELDLDHSAILLEPVGRNTAPAVAVAALFAEQNFACDSLLLVFPADHVIREITSFTEALQHAVAAAREGFLATFGVVPTKAHSGYGYVRAGEPIAGTPTFAVAEFVEKPDIETAQQYVQAGNYYWNSGMFVFTAYNYLKALRRFSPQIVDACQAALDGAAADLDFMHLDREAFTRSPSISIDYAVMEKAVDAELKICVVPLEAGWNDVGSWSSLWDIAEKDENGNALRGDVTAMDTHNCYLFSEQSLLVTLGVEDLIVIQTADALLVANRNRSEDIKSIVEQLSANQREEAVLHRKVSRPWGTYDCIDQSARFKVKRITVRPGAKLSLQRHRHRAEHWVVVKGQARVTRGEEVIILEENQSTYIPIGMKHALENPGSTPLELIEVQSGSYLGEDDIERFEDLYGRA